ncbi:MAG TPA: hypothetical protein VFD32_23375 [Dehalococcoidia bacterium]|nr:hypothetical protein [Dehalococcoidia bacterium]
MTHTCRLGSFFSRCHEPAVGSCQYCDRGFCAAHGELLPTGEEICAREVCQRKRADLETHLRFRERALQRNQFGLCGIEGCGDERWGQCSKCQALFCEGHLTSRSESVREGYARFSRPASFCNHCLQRRKLWSKR